MRSRDTRKCGRAIKGRFNFEIVPEVSEIGGDLKSRPLVSCVSPCRGVCHAPDGFLTIAPEPFAMES